MAQAGDPLGQLHVGVELLVDARGVDLGPAGQVNAVRRARLDAGDQVLVELLGDERCGGCQQLAHRHQHGVERAQGCGVAIPEAATAQAHVPVAQVVHEIRDRPRGAEHVVVLHGEGHVAHQAVELRENPAIEEVGSRNSEVRARISDFRILTSNLQLPFTQIRVRHEE
jgi:hypothetical protein